jgi:hypothetical protein
MAEISGAFHRARVAGPVSAPGATYRAQAPLYPKRRAALPDGVRPDPSFRLAARDR